MRSRLGGLGEELVPAARSFLGEQDLQTQLADWHEEVNERRLSRANLVLAEKVSRLRLLKLHTEDLDQHDGLARAPPNRAGCSPLNLGYSPTTLYSRIRRRRVSGK